MGHRAHTAGQTYKKLLYKRGRSAFFSIRNLIAPHSSPLSTPKPNDNLCSLHTSLLPHNISCNFQMECHIKVNRDAQAREYFWTVAIGKPTSSSTLWPTSLAATRRFGHNILNLNTQVPKQIPVDSPRQSIPRTALSPVLQTYFCKMQRATYHTCHPREIHAEAMKIVTSIFDHKESVDRVAKTIYLGGIARIEYSRTVALVVHECMTQLIWRNWGLKKALEHGLVELATSAFINGWTSVSLHYHHSP